MFSFKQAVGGIFCSQTKKRDTERICIALSGENQQGDVLQLSVNGREVTLPAKIDAGNCKTLASNLPEADCSIFTLSVG